MGVFKNLNKGLYVLTIFFFFFLSSIINSIKYKQCKQDNKKNISNEVQGFLRGKP